MPALIANDVGIHYEDRGTGPPAMFISGLGQDHTAWNLQLDHFARSKRCIAPDNRGSGESAATPGPYSAWLMASDLGAVLKKLDPGPVDVMGISMGGLIAQALAEHFPDRVRSLCVVGSWARTSAYQKSLFESWTRAYRAGGLDLFLTVAVPTSFAPATYDRASFVDDLVAAALAAEHRITAEAFESQAAACIVHEDPGNLSQIGCPTLVVCGRHDRIAPPEGSQELAGAIPGARLHFFEGSGHLPIWEEPEEFNAVLDEFWSGFR